MENTPDTEQRYYPDVIAASIDILGFGRLIELDSERAFRAAAWLVGNVLLDKAVRADGGGPDISLYERSAYFGDSCYLFGDTGADLRDQATCLAAKCASLLYVGLSGGYSPSKLLVPLRIGIARGDLRVGTIRVGERRQELRIGSAMLKAHRLQEAQVWLGGAVALDVPPPSSNSDDFRLSYSVPRHQARWQRWMDSCSALNWPKLSGIASPLPGNKPVPFLHDLIEVMQPLAMPGMQAFDKWQNTIHFARHTASCVGSATHVPRT